MTQETEDVVAEQRLFLKRQWHQESERAERLDNENRSLSERLAVQDDLLRRARSLIRPYCAADEELRAFSDELTVCLVEGKE